jgi:hypothetical protein
MGLSKADEQKAVAAAKNEISAFSDMYNRCGVRPRRGAPPVPVRPCAARVSLALTTLGACRMLKQCFEKCVEHFHDNELSLGENMCVDR